MIDSKLLSPKKCFKPASSKTDLKWLTIMWVYIFFVLDVCRQEEGVIWSSYPPGDPRTGDCKISRGLCKKKVLLTLP